MVTHCRLIRDFVRGTDWNLFVSISRFESDNAAYFLEQFSRSSDDELNCQCACDTDGFCQTAGSSHGVNPESAVCIGLQNYFVNVRWDFSSDKPDLLLRWASRCVVNVTNLPPQLRVTAF